MVRGLPCAPLPQLALTHYCVVIRPILSPLFSANQTLPSGPAVMPSGGHPNLFPQVLGSGNKVELPPVVMRPMLFPKCKVNQWLPSAPAVMPQSPLLFPDTRNSLILPH